MDLTSPEHTIVSQEKRHTESEVLMEEAPPNHSMEDVCWKGRSPVWNFMLTPGLKEPPGSQELTLQTNIMVL